MLELLFGLLVAGLVVVIAIPCVIVLGALTLILSLAFGLIALPFQILFHGAGFVIGSIAKFFAALVVLTLLLFIGLVFVFVPLLPLAPFLLALGLAWLVYRLVRGPSRTAARA
jgi:hypothetical protein